MTTILTGRYADVEKPDGENVVWNMPLSLKHDMAVVLEAYMQEFGLDVVVLKNGAFETSMLHNPDTKLSRPVITLELESDSASREALGELMLAANRDDPRVVAENAAQLAVSNGYFEFKGELSSVSVNVSIYDLVPTRADDLYRFVKTAMMAAQAMFASMGYLDPPLRSAGSDSTGVLQMDGGPSFLHTRQLTYMAKHYDYIAALAEVARLVAVKQTAESPDASTPGVVQVNIGG